MKRLLQIAALISVALLAGQPAFAGLTCAARTAAQAGCAADCGMAMSQAAAMQMSADYPMSPQVAPSGCTQDCCQHGLLQGLVQPAATGKSKAAGTMPGAAAQGTMASALTVFAAVAPDGSMDGPSARPILFRVLRI